MLRLLEQRAQALERARGVEAVLPALVGEHPRGPLGKAGAACNLWTHDG